MKKTLTLWVLAAAVALPVPLLAQSRQEQQMAASLLMIQEQQQQTALAVAQLAEVVKAMNPRFDEVVEAMRKRMADLEQTIKGQGAEISAIRAQTQDTGTRIGSLSDEIEAQRKTGDALVQTVLQLQQALQALQAPPAVDPNAPAGQTSQGAAPLDPAVLPLPAAPPLTPPDLSKAGLSPGRMLSEARGDYQSGRFDLAITGFKALIDNFADTQAAAEAQLLIGDSYSNLGNQWPQAIAAYNLVIKNYAKSPFVPAAYWGRAQAESRAGQSEASRLSLEHVVKTYPETDYGSLARQRLLAPARPQ